MNSLKSYIKFICIALLLITTTLQSECEDCKKLREEITKAWKMNIDLTKEMRALTQDLLKHSDTIRKFHSM